MSLFFPFTAVQTLYIGMLLFHHHLDNILGKSHNFSDVKRDFPVTFISSLQLSNFSYLNVRLV